MLKVISTVSPCQNKTGSVRVVRSVAEGTGIQGASLEDGPCRGVGASRDPQREEGSTEPPLDTGWYMGEGHPGDISL